METAVKGVKNLFQSMKKRASQVKGIKSHLDEMYSNALLAKEETFPVELDFINEVVKEEQIDEEEKQFTSGSLSFSCDKFLQEGVE